MNQNTISQLLTRLSSSSPTLFKKLQAIFFSLAGLVFVLICLTPLHLNLHGFEAYVNWNTFIVLLGFGGVNMLPVANPEVLKKDTEVRKDDDEPGSDPDKPKTEKPGTP